MKNRKKLFFVFILMCLLLTGCSKNSKTLELTLESSKDDIWEYEVANKEIVEVKNKKDKFTITALKEGETVVVFKKVNAMDGTVQNISITK